MWLLSMQIKFYIAWKVMILRKNSGNKLLKFNWKADDNTVIKGSFDWVNYDTSEERTLNYMNDFLKSNEEK